MLRIPWGIAFLLVASAAARAQPAVGARLTDVPLQVIQLADDDGSRHALVSVPQMRGWVQFANRAFGQAGIRFTFPGDAEDHINLRNTLLNSMDPRDGPEKFRDAFLKANEVAAKYPGRITVFIRWGPDAKPSGGADSGQDWNFVIMGPFDAMRHCGHPHIDAFGHELGHHFGLAHTFVGHGFESQEQAAAFLRAHGDKPEAFDGDGLADTAPDPLIRSLECKHTSEITLDGIKFVLPRHNLMSYYDERDSLTPQQCQRVDSVLRTRLKNQMLIPTNKCAASLEAESLKVASAHNASTAVQSMRGVGILGLTHAWSSDAQLFVRAADGGSIDLIFPISATGQYALNVYLTQAPDYGIGQFSVDAHAAGAPIDCFAPMVIPTGKIPLGTLTLNRGEHRLHLTITGKNQLPANYYFALDCLELVAGPQ